MKSSNGHITFFRWTDIETVDYNENTRMIYLYLIEDKQNEGLPRTPRFITEEVIFPEINHYNNKA